MQLHQPIVKCITTSWQLVQGIVHRFLQHDDILNGVHGFYDTLIQDQMLRKCGKLSKGYNKVNPLIFKMCRQTYFRNSPEWSRFMTIVKKQHKLDEVSYHKLFDILKQYQKEVNELCAERLARNANPLALVAISQANQYPYYQTSKSHKSFAPSSKPSIPTRSHTATKYKGKEIAKPITPPSEIASEEDSDPKQAQMDKDMQKNLALIAKYFKKIYKTTNNNLRTSSNLRNKNVDTTQRYKNDNQSGQFGNQRTVNVAWARENVRSPVVQQSGIQCFNCKEFRHFAKECRKSKRVKDFTYHKEKINTCLAEMDDSSIILDSPDMCEDDIQNDQNDVESDDERVAFANLIVNLKLDVDEKKIQKKLKKANTTLAQELTECKTILAKTSKSLGESISVQDSCLVALQTKQAEFEKYKEFNDRTIDYDKLERKLNEALEIVDNAWIKHLKYQFRAPTAQNIEILIQTCLIPLATKTQNDSFRFVHELKQEMHADLKYVESLEKEIDELESDKAEFSNMYDVILQECVSNDVKCSYLESVSDLDVLSELQCLYLHKVKESKHSISLEIALQKRKERVKHDTVWNEKASNVFRKEREQYLKIQDLKAKLQDKNIAISELKKLIEKGKGKYVETKFDKPSVVRQPNAQRIPKPSVLGLSKPVNAQTLPQRASQAEISLHQDVPSTSDCRLIKLENQVQRLMEDHLALTQSTQVNKITTSCEICNGPYDTQYCMEDPEQAFVEYASSRTDEAEGKWYTFKPEQTNLGDAYCNAPLRKEDVMS
nr:MAK10-like protein [Tanacetum cinerariifolium]